MQYRVLIVDDEIDVLNVLEEMLEKLGFNAVAVTSGVRAIELIKSSQFDLVITDLVMPDKNGIDIINEINSSSNPVHVLITAGVDLPDLDMEIPGIDKYSFIKKPFTLDDIKTKLSAFWADRKIMVKQEVRER